MERTWLQEEEELEHLSILHQIPTSSSPPFHHNNSSQANIHDLFFLETAFSHVNLSDLCPLPCTNSQSPSPFDSVQSPLQSPTVYQLYPSPSYNNHIQQTTLKVDQTCLQDTPITQIPSFRHTHERISDKDHYLTLSQSHLYQQFSYKSDKNSVTGGNHHCFLQSTKPSLFSSTMMRSECNKQFLTKGCSNNNNKFCPSVNRHYRERPVLDLKNLSMLWSEIQLYTSLEDLRGRIVSEAKNQHGCRFLQMKFEERRKEDIEMIFLEVKDHICDLMVDPFGNYLVQKLVEVCTEEQVTEIILSATKNKFELICTCLDAHGTRAMQKLLGYLTTAQQICCVISALQPGTVRLSKDNNGYHVLQQCFQQFSSDYNMPLSIKILDHCIEVATDRSGCCVLQQCVANAQGEQKESLIAKIIANALLLAQDKFGNCVVQFLLGLNLPYVTGNVLRQLEGSFVHLSIQKFSSNVVERCLKEANQEELTRIIRELLGSPNPLMLLQDAYGNYVIQTALAVAKGPVYAAIVTLVEMHAVVLRIHPYGNKILSATINSSKLYARSCTCRRR